MGVLGDLAAVGMAVGYVDIECPFDLTLALYCWNRMI